MDLLEWGEEIMNYFDCFFVVVVVGFLGFFLSISLLNIVNTSF